jgi:glutaredoxin
VFRDPNCSYCTSAISALNSAGKDFKVVDANSSQRRELHQLTSSSSVPSIWVKEKYVGGCNDGPESWMGIKKLINNGKLNEMLAK